MKLAYNGRLFLSGVNTGYYLEIKGDMLVLRRTYGHDDTPELPSLVGFTDGRYIFEAKEVRKTTAEDIKRSFLKLANMFKFSHAKEGEPQRVWGRNNAVANKLAKWWVINNEDGFHLCCSVNTQVISYDNMENEIFFSMGGSWREEKDAVTGEVFVTSKVTLATPLSKVLSALSFYWDKLDELNSAGYQNIRINLQTLELHALNGG